MHSRPMRFLFTLILLVCTNAYMAHAQLGTAGNKQGGLGSRSMLTPEAPKVYEVAGVTVSGTKYLDEDLLISVSGLSVGTKIKLPNDENISRAIRNLWKQELFSNVTISITKIISTKIFLDIKVEERPRLSRYNFRGIKKSEA